MIAPAPRDTFLAQVTEMAPHLGLVGNDVSRLAQALSKWSNSGLRTIWPSQAAWAALTGDSERAIRGTVRRLRLAGVMGVNPSEVHRDRHGQIKHRTTNRYWCRSKVVARLWRKLRGVKVQRAPGGKSLPRNLPPGEEVPQVVPDRPPPGGLGPAPPTLLPELIAAERPPEPSERTRDAAADAARDRVARQVAQLRRTWGPKDSRWSR